MNVEDEYAILSAVWIIACNDDSASITYQGLVYRLKTPPEYDIKGLVRHHPELFRQGMSKPWLKQWKAKMRPVENVPGFIREAKPELQQQMIDSLGPTDGFRSQFRAGLDAPRSEVAVIEWGLNHIERLRKARSEAREATVKVWQVMLVFGTSVLGVLASITAALLSYSAAMHAALKH